MSDPFAWLDVVAADRGAAGLRRGLAAHSPGLIDCASNDYLGLSHDARVVAAAASALREWGAGSTGSRLVTGTTEVHLELESELASYAGTEAALVFSSGYLANLGVLQALAGRETLVVSDAVNHASLIDACRLSRATVVVVPHRDVAAINAALANRVVPHALVVTDAVFSVDGDAAPLRDIVATARRHHAGVVIDEAHSFGVVGDGRGLCASLGLAGAADVVVTVTLSKALGAQGGAVLAARSVIDHLIDAARPFIFDTGLAPSSAAAALAALQIVRAEPDLARAARQSATRIAGLARDAGLAASTPAAAVASITIGTPRAALEAAAACREHGVLVGCFRPPSVPDGVSRLRLTGRATMTVADHERIASALEAAASVPRAEH